MSLAFKFSALVFFASANLVGTIEGSDHKKVVLVAGETAKVDDMGHHDYLAGCECLAELLKQSPGVDVVRINDGWPANEAIFENASTIVFYTDGGGKQAFLSNVDRVAKIKKLVESRIGLVMIHQAVDFPEAFASEGKQWLGGVYQTKVSGRGHWDSSHVDFPKHPITRGVEPWKINDGWLNSIDFVENKKGVTPLVWSGKEYAGSRAGLDKDIVGWAYERPDGGRSFSFTGLDAHSAWSLSGMRQLMLNGVLWSAGIEIPASGAPCAIEDEKLLKMQTPREPKPKAKPKSKPSDK